MRSKQLRHDIRDFALYSARGFVNVEIAIIAGGFRGLPGGFRLLPETLRGLVGGITGDFRLIHGGSRLV